MVKPNKGGVYFRGTFEEVIKTSIHLRTASRVFWIFEKSISKTNKTFTEKL